VCVRACVRRPVWRWWGVWLCACVRASTCVVVLLVCVGGGVRASAQESGDMLVFVDRFLKYLYPCLERFNKKAATIRRPPHLYSITSELPTIQN